MRISLGICTEVPPESNLQGVTQGHHRNHEKAMQRNEGGDNRRRGMPRPSAPFSEYPTVHEYSTVRGDAQEQKRTDDFRQTRESEVQIWESKFLVQGILCGYGRKDLANDQISLKEYMDPFTGSKRE